MAAATANPHFRFLDLPQELQHKILENVDMKVPGCHICWMPGSKFQLSSMTLEKIPSSKRNLMSLLLVSKVFSNKCQQLLWSQNHFFIMPSREASVAMASGINKPQPYTGTEFLSKFASGKLPGEMLQHIRTLTLFDLTNQTNLPMENPRNEWFRQLISAYKAGLRLDRLHIHAPNAWEDSPDYDYEAWAGESGLTKLANLRCLVAQEIWPLENPPMPRPAMARQLLLEMLNSRMYLRYSLRRKDQEPAGHLFLHRFSDMKDWKTFHGKAPRSDDWVEDVIIKFSPFVE